MIIIHIFLCGPALFPSPKMTILLILPLNSKNIVDILKCINKKHLFLNFIKRFIKGTLCLILCDPRGCSTPGFSILLCLLEFAQIHVHWVGDAIQQSHPLLLPSPPALSLSQHQGLFQWVGSFPVSWLFASGSKVLGLQL